MALHFSSRLLCKSLLCLAEVRQSDVLVVIVGLRYGSIVPALGISYSEVEYAEGFGLKKPCLV
jgi:hypothetical protein